MDFLEPNIGRGPKARSNKQRCGPHFDLFSIGYTLYVYVTHTHVRAHAHAHTQSSLFPKTCERQFGGPGNLYGFRFN